MFNYSTKEARLQSQAFQFENLLKQGYTQETYKGLQIFTQSEDGKFFCKIFRGTAAHHESYTGYRTAERMAEAITQRKSSFDRSEAYKAEAKANKKLSCAANTAAAIREELKTVFPGIKFSVTSSNFAGGNSVDIRWEDGPTSDQVNAISKKYQYGSFNGMEDIYEHTNSRDDIPQAKYVQTSRSISTATREILLPFAETIHAGHDFGHYNADDLLHQIFYASSIPAGATITGLAKTDCTCGSGPAEFYRISFEGEQATTKDETPAPVELPAGKIQIVDYSEKAVAVIGDFSAHYEKLISIGGKYNPRLSCGKGIIFSKKKLEEVKAVLSVKSEAPAQEVCPQSKVSDEIYSKAQRLAQHQEEEVRNAAKAAIWGHENGYTIHVNLIEIVNKAKETVKAELRKEIAATVQFFADTDLQIYGQIMPGTEEIARIQKVEIEQPANPLGLVHVQQPTTQRPQLFLI